MGRTLPGIWLGGGGGCQQPGGRQSGVTKGKKSQILSGVADQRDLMCLNPYQKTRGRDQKREEEGSLAKGGEGSCIKSEEIRVRQTSELAGWKRELEWGESSRPRTPGHGGKKFGRRMTGEKTRITGWARNKNVKVALKKGLKRRSRRNWGIIKKWGNVSLRPLK